jgi:hypothetical protein
MVEAFKSSRHVELWLEADAAVRIGKEFDFNRCAGQNFSQTHALIRFLRTTNTCAQRISPPALFVHGK